MRALARVVLAVALLVACTDGQSPGEIDPAQTPAAQAAGSEAADLRLTLEHRLGHTTLLGIEAMRAAALDDPAAGAIARWWDDAATEVAAAVETVDPEAAEVFSAAWDPVADLLLEYATAAGDDNAEALADELDHAATELATAVAGTTDEHWDPGDADEAWRQHAEQLVQIAAAHAEGDADTAATRAREEHARMRIVAQHWAEGLAERLDLSGAVASGRTELQSAMTQLLGEHAALLLATIRHVRSEAGDADATAAALNGNTEDLGTALAAVLDRETAEDFTEQWRSHVDVLLRRGTSDRKSTQRKAAGELDESTDALANLLSDATGLDPDSVREPLTDLQQAAARHSEAVAADRLPRAGQQAALAYEAAAAFGDVIAAAIADDRPDDFPAQ